MGNFKTKDLDRLGYTENRVRSLAITAINKHYKHADREQISKILNAVKEAPRQYTTDAIWGKVAFAILDEPEARTFEAFELLRESSPYEVFGRQHIDAAALKQMDLAMRLPVSVNGALMPDAHTGFGLPIGGVLTTENSVIPFAVGVDIGCRMALTVFEETDQYFKSHAYAAEQALRKHTHFGIDGYPETPASHDIMDHPAFAATTFLKRLQGKAARQLGSSGGGNHFVEFGTIEFMSGNLLAMPAGRKYVALLSHSGSRGLGANIARRYTEIAMDKCRLPESVRNLAWLDLTSEEGQEYWISMQLAGDYAVACHETIHHSLAKALSLNPLTHVSNHHNFAWIESFGDGSKYVVHRKGATPAGEGVMGIIPGNMCSPAYLISGKGNESSLQSASHGAGRAMSRQRAKENITVSGLRKVLASSGVQLIGGNVEEAPDAYKDIASVMRAQRALVNVEGMFHPKIVRMNKD